MKTLFLGTTLLFAAPAFAQGDDASGAGGGSATVGAGADANAGGAGAGAGATVAASAGGTMGGAWSDQLINNPQTLPKAGLGLLGDFEILKLNIPNPLDPTMSSSVTAEFLELGAGYGVSDKLTVGATYAVDIHDDGGTFPSDDRWKGPLGLYGAFNLINKDKLSVTAGADFSINLGNTDDKAIHAGLSAKYMVAPKIALYTGNVLPIGPAGQHLSISLADSGPITFAIPVGVALQATPQIFAFADTTLASFSISNSANEFIFSDFIPLDAGVLFRAAKDLDVGVSFTDDLKNAGDAYLFGLMARYYKH